MSFGNYKVFIVSVNNLRVFNRFQTTEFFSRDFQPAKKKMWFIPGLQGMKCKTKDTYQKSWCMAKTSARHLTNKVENTRITLFLTYEEYGFLHWNTV
jgi:hypothetical protein